MREEISTADLAHWRERNEVFDQLEMAVWGTEANALSGAESKPERISLEHVTPGLFSMLGVRPALGKFLSEEEFAKQSWSAAAISYQFWQRHFGGDPHVLGKSVVVDNGMVVVTAVLPAGFDLFGTGPADVTVFVSADATSFDATVRWFAGFGRLKRGITIGQAQASMDILAHATPRRSIPTPTSM